MRNRLKNYILIAIIFTFSLTSIFVFFASAEKKVISIDTDASCITSSCHTGMAKKKYIHVPASEGENCITCHEVLTAGEHRFKLTSEVETLCFNCHDDVVNKQYKHVPVKNGECIMCHDPHQSDNPKQLLAPPTSELCFMCHDADNFKGTTPHRPVTEGECLECHHQHTSDNIAQLKKPVPELCFGCHNIKLEDYKGITLPSPKDIYENKEMKLHKPFAEGRCLTCHFPHPADTHRILRKPYPAEFYAAYSDETYGICFMCHNNLKKAFSEPRTLTDTNFRNGNLNLHYRHVNRTKGRTCRTCHHHHGSKNPRLIRDTFSFGKRELTITYEKTDTGGACAPVCHAAVKYDRYVPVINSIKTTLQSGSDATEEELRLSKERDFKKQKEGEVTKNKEKGDEKKK